MISVWRIEKSEYLKTFLTGEGAKLYGGRWNNKGTPVVYTSESIALAAWEKYIHVNRTQQGVIPLAAVDLNLVKIMIPEDIEIVEITKFPTNWKKDLAYSKDIGSNWATAKKTIALKVPSILLPKCFNYVLNPLHSKISKVIVKDIEKFSFDPRIWN